MELCSDLRHPVFDQLNRRLDLCKLCFIDLVQVFRAVQLREIQSGKKFKPNGTGVCTDAQFQPFEEAPSSLYCDPEHLTRGKFFLLHHLRGNIAMLLEPLQNSVRLALTQVPDMPQFSHETLVQVIAVAGAGDQKSQQCEFRGEVA